MSESLAGSADHHTRLWSLWGKFPGGSGPDYFHPALAHMIDVGSVAEALAPNWTQAFAMFLGVDVEVARRWGVFLIAAHDVGKLHPGFLQKVDDPRVVADLEATELPLIPKVWLARRTSGFDHGLQSVVTLTRWLAPRLDPSGLEPRHLALALAHAVGAHHGRFHLAGLKNGHASEYAKYDRGGWAAVQDLALDHLKRIWVGDAGQLRTEVRDLSALVLALSGLTSICDWIGSSAEYFPPTGRSISLDQYPARAGRLAAEAVARRRMLEPERFRAAAGPAGPAPFARMFPATPEPRPAQSAVLGLADPTGFPPGLLLIEAPMGEGKTEAAFWWAAASQSGRCRGLYVALPTQATSNAMHRRLGRVFAALDPTAELPLVRLIHGTAALESEEFRVTPNTGTPADRREALGAESWFAPRKRTLWATYAVGTVDQALMAASAIRHGFVRLAGLAGKAVIIDEVHAYDVYMTGILERLLRWLAVLGTPVALLSATLPSSRRSALMKAYAGGTVGSAPDAYPVIGFAKPGGEVRWVAPVPSGRSLRIAVERQTDPGDDRDARAALAAALLRRIAEGGCVAWIHNTVDEAQASFAALRRLAPNLGVPVELRLLHARFRRMDRSRIEEEVVAKYGPGGERPARSILVATQVVEQSLDVDFDLMVSQLAPVDLLLQRLGRLFRHASTRRPVGMTEPRLLLLMPSVQDGRPRFGPTERVYARFVLLKTLLALVGRGAIELPGDIRGLVEAAYDDLLPEEARATPAGLDAADFAVAKGELDQRRHGDRRQAEMRLLPEPHPTEPFYAGLGLEFDESDDDAPQDAWITARTRLGPPSRNILLLHRVNGQLCLEPEGSPAIDLGRAPDRTLRRELLLRSVAIARRELVAALEESQSPPGLLECAALRHHAVLELEGGIHHLPDVKLTVRLDPKLGLVYERASEPRS